MMCFSLHGVCRPLPYRLSDKQKIGLIEIIAGRLFQYKDRQRDFAPKFLFVYSSVQSAAADNQQHSLIQDSMAAIGSLVFCTDCGNLLPATQGSEKNSLQCECCDAWNKGLRRPHSSQTRYVQALTHWFARRHWLKSHRHAVQAVRLSVFPAAKIAVQRPSCREAQA